MKDDRPKAPTDPGFEAFRPKTRGECMDGVRPCPWVSCRYHLAIEVRASGKLRVICEDVDEMEETCALDVADRGSTNLEAIGKLVALTRERVRQIEARTLEKFEALLKKMGITRQSR